MLKRVVYIVTTGLQVVNYDPIYEEMAMKSFLSFSSQEVASMYSFLMELFAGCHLLEAGALLDLLFGPEVGDMFLRNVS
jgi:hypothetical protein